MTSPLRVEGDIPVDLHVENGANYLFISKKQRTLTHGLHKYPAKFFPELPRWLIEKYTNEGDVVLDPFMGSATTNIEAMLLGRNSVGVDVDPFSCMLARAKTSILPVKALERTWDDLKQRVIRYKEPKTLRDVPDFPNRLLWFESFMLKELAYIKKQIYLTDCTDKMRLFFLLNFSGIIRAVSNADNNCTRTVVRKNLNKQIKRMMGINLFIKRTDQQVANMVEFASLKPTGNVKVLNKADARRMHQLKDNSIDFAVTSPPYANAVDYPRTHQLEIYWLDITHGSLRDIKAKHVGTEVVSSFDYKIHHKTGCIEADVVISRIYRKDPRRAYIASKYLLDMFENLREVNRVLKPGRCYAIVIGDNMMCGQRFESWKYLQDMAPSLGYSVEVRFVSEIINHFIKIPRQERINEDHILVLRKKHG